MAMATNTQKQLHKTTESKHYIYTPVNTYERRTFRTAVKESFRMGIATVTPNKFGKQNNQNIYTPTNIGKRHTFTTTVRNIYDGYRHTHTHTRNKFRKQSKQAFTHRTHANDTHSKLQNERDSQ